MLTDIHCHVGTFGLFCPKNVDRVRNAAMQRAGLQYRPRVYISYFAHWKSQPDCGSALVADEAVSIVHTEPSGPDPVGDHPWRDPDRSMRDPLTNFGHGISAQRAWVHLRVRHTEPGRPMSSRPGRARLRITPTGLPDPIADPRVARGKE